MQTRDKTGIFNPTFKAVEEFNEISETQFHHIISLDKPAIINNCDFGECLKKWDLHYLNEKLSDNYIVIHESDEKKLNFISKNFKYKTCKFSEFATKLVDCHACVYLRSTNRDIRAKKPTRIEAEFPQLAADISPPNFIPFGQNNHLYHSSILRIASSNVQIWTHFDLYENVLCQIVGTKRVILIPPDESKNLYIIGDKSPVNDFENWTETCKSYPLIEKANLYQCYLKPSQILYIPTLWWHNIKTDSPGNGCNYSIGFNIFWKDNTISSGSIYAERDIYGNKNLLPFDAAQTNLDKAINHLDKLPEKYKKFYKLMLFNMMRRKLFDDDHVQLS